LNLASVLVGTVHGAISGCIKECFIEVWDKMDKKYVIWPFFIGEILLKSEDKSKISKN
jgi:hypothetical protein